MGIFSKLSTENLEEAGDRIGGNSAVPSGIYDETIKVAYVGKSSGGAMSITLITESNGKELRSTQWVTNKQGENFYPDKQDAKKKHPLPGFTVINDICLMTTGKPLVEQDTVEKVLKVYNPSEQKEVPTKVDTLDDLVGKTIKLGVLREITFKQKKNDAGAYVNTDEKRSENVIDKVFHPETGRTVTEYMHSVDPGEFLPAWEAKNKDVDRDRTKGSTTPVGGAAGGMSGSGRPGAAGPGASSAKKNIFG